MKEINENFLQRLLERALCDDACDKGTSSGNFLDEFEESHGIEITDINVGFDTITFVVNDNEKINFKIDVSKL